MLALTILLGLNTLMPLNADRYLQLLKQHQGTVILVNIWATWCIPCRDEFPGLVRLYRDRHGPGLTMISISMDQPVDSEKAEAFLREHQATFPAYILSGENFAAFQQAVDPDWPGAIPITLLFDTRGEATFKRVGLVSYEELVEQLDRLE